MGLLDQVVIATSADDEPWHHLSRLLARTSRRLQTEHGIGLDLEEATPPSLLKMSAAGWGLVCRFTAGGATYIPADETHHCRRWLSQVLTEFFLVHWEANLVRDLIAADYPQLSRRQQAALCRAVLRRLARPAPQPDSGQAASWSHSPLPVQGSRQDFVSLRLKEYLSEYDHIHLDGFVTFRLRPYVHTIQQAVEEVKADFRVQQGHEDLLELLKVFVDGQPARTGLVHVFTATDGRFTLSDEEGIMLDYETLAKMVTGVGGGEIHRGDLLLSALVSLAPRQVLLHQPAPTDSSLLETVKAVKRVFVGRAFSCSGCKICRERTF